MGNVARMTAAKFQAGLHASLQGCQDTWLPVLGECKPQQMQLLQ